MLCDPVTIIDEIFEVEDVIVVPSTQVFRNGDIAIGTTFIRVKS